MQLARFENTPATISGSNISDFAHTLFTAVLNAARPSNKADDLHQQLRFQLTSFNSTCSSLNDIYRTPHAGAPFFESYWQDFQKKLDEAKHGMLIAIPEEIASADDFYNWVHQSQ